MRRLTSVVLALVLWSPADAAVDLIWHAETVAGETLVSREPDRPVNPASVMKIATTLWALEELGPQHRFATRFRADPSQIAAGVLAGDLWVEGGGDPDFHPENVFLVAEQLNGLGIRKVAGSLRVGERFWIGWENGSEKRRDDVAARGGLMAVRLRAALDPKRWDPGTRRSWERYAARRGLDPARPFPVAVAGGARFTAQAPTAPILVEVVSKPLETALRRFNVYSNNDIERIGELLGGPAELQGWLIRRLRAKPGEVRVETTSGLGSNRLTPRLVVRLLRELLQACDRLGVAPVELLPVAGCDAGTLRESFPELARGKNATSVAGKTGTLLRTDGGVAALAGYALTLSGERLFFVVAPGSGEHILEARAEEEQWVLDLLHSGGGPHPRSCPAQLAMPDEGASVGTDRAGGERVVRPQQGSGSTDRR